MLLRAAQQNFPTLVAACLLLSSLGLSGCASPASASSSGAHRAFTYTTEGGDSGGPIRMRRLDTEEGELGKDSVQSPDKMFLGDMAVHPYLPLLFATEGNLRIQVFQVNSENGYLSPKFSTPVSASLESDDELLVHPGGRFLYLFHNRQISSFTLVESNGTLQPNPSILPQGAVDLNHGVIDQSGQLLYAADRSQGLIWGFRIEENGGLTAISSYPLASLSGATFRRLVIDPSNRFLFALDDNGDGVVGYAIQNDGALAANGSKSVGASADRHLDMVVRGERLYVAEQNQFVTKVFRIDKIGSLSPDGQFAQGGGLLNLAPNSSVLLHANNSGTFSLRPQRLNSDGSLSPLESKSLPNACLDLETVVFKSSL